MYKVLIVVPGFAEISRDPIDRMVDAGFEIIEKDYGLAGLNHDEDEFCRIIKGVDALIPTAMDRVTRRIVEHADRLKIIAIRSAGFEGTDLTAATDHGVVVTHNPGSNSDPVADMAMGLMLSVSRRIGWMDRGMRNGKFDDLRINTRDIFGKTLGIIGLGNIGKKVAIRAKGFSMKVLYHDIVAYTDFEKEYDVQKVSLEQLLDSADIISLHVPLDDSTRQMIGKREIDRMKPKTILINTCRGGVVDEEAVYAALESGHLYGHGIDVFEDEPPQCHDLLHHENVMSSPHVAGLSEDGLINMASLSASKVIRFLNQGTIPENVLNPGVLERMKL